MLLFSAGILISKRFTARNIYSQIASLETQAINLNMDYSRLQLELATFSSHIILEDYAINHLNMIKPSKLNIIKFMELKK